MFGFLVFCGIIGAIIYFVKKAKREKEQEEIENQKNKQNAFKEKWERKVEEISINGLPILESGTLQLTANEVCHFEGEAFFGKLKQQVVGYEGGSRGVSIRVMKGLSFRVGNHRGELVKKDVLERTNGKIYLTSKKIVFTAVKNSSIINYKDIINLNVVDDMLQIQTEKKTYLFGIVDYITFMIILEYIINGKEESSANNLLKEIE